MVVGARARQGAEDGFGTAGAPLLAPLVLVALMSPACAELELLTKGYGGGPDPPPSGSLSVSFIDAGRPEEGPNVVDFLRSRGVDSLDGIVVSNPDADHIGGFLDVFDAFPVEDYDSAPC